MADLQLNDKSKFLDPEKLLFQAGLSSGQKVADLGAGSGFYAVAAGKIVGEQGLVYVVDIMEQALDHVQAEARLKNLRNVKTFRCDLDTAHSCLKIPTGEMDMVVLANVTHQIKNRKELFAEVYRMLKTGGKVVVVEWNQNPSPIGPLASERISENDLNDLATKTHLKPVQHLDTDSYHYGLVFIK